MNQPYSIQDINDSTDIKIKKLIDNGGRDIVDIMIKAVLNRSMRVGVDLPDQDQLRFIVTVIMSLLCDPNTEYGDEIGGAFIRLWWKRGGFINKQYEAAPEFFRNNILEKEIESKVEFLLDYGMQQIDIENFLGIPNNRLSYIINKLRQQQFESS